MMKTETIEYFLTDEDGKTYPVVCTVTYKRGALNRAKEDTLERTNSECAEAEPQARHYGTERD